MARNPSTNQIVPDPSKFPDGLASVASQVHALGLKMGIYRCVHYALIVTQVLKEIQRCWDYDLCWIPGLIRI